MRTPFMAIVVFGLVIRLMGVWGFLSDKRWCWLEEMSEFAGTATVVGVEGCFYVATNVIVSVSMDSTTRKIR
jgi:hypothetical protein